MAPTEDTSRTGKHGTDERIYARVGTKGQFVIPAPMRRQLGLKPGQKLRLNTEGGKLIVTPIDTAALLERLRGSLAGPGPNMVEALMREHREEIERDEAEVARRRERHGHHAPEAATAEAGRSSE